MKKIIALLLAALMLVGMMAGCSTDEPKPDKPSESNAKPGTHDTCKVAVSVRLTDMYGAWLKVAFESIDIPGVEITVFDNQDDTAKTMEICENIQQQDYDILFIQNSLSDLSTAYKAVEESGCAVVGFNLKQDWASALSPVITCGEYAMGYMVGETAAKNLPENANVVILDGPAGLWLSEDRHKGIVEGLAASGRTDITVLDSQDATFDKAKAMQKTEDWLQSYDKIDGVLAASDSMALGAVEAFKSSEGGLGSVQFYGIDGLTDACQALKNGEMTASVLQDALQYSGIASDLIKKWMAGELDLMNDTTVYEFEASLITPENVDDQLKYYKDNGLMD